MEQVIQIPFYTLLRCVTAYRNEAKWEIEEHRVKFLYRVNEVIQYFHESTGFNLLDVFTREEVDYALDKAALSRPGDPYYWMGRTFVKFALLCDYTDVPETTTTEQRGGRLVASGTTALHHASRNPQCSQRLVRNLFRIYQRQDVHYVDMFGSTHFHVACQFGLHDVVKVFLAFGRDPNQVARLTGDRPLSLAWWNDRIQTGRVLQLHGADSNLAARRTKQVARAHQEQGTAFVYQEMTAEEKYEQDYEC